MRLSLLQTYGADPAQVVQAAPAHASYAAAAGVGVRVTLVACGTRGDVQPMAVLGAALQARGHEALLLAPPESGVVAAQAGCPFRPFGRSIEALIQGVPDMGSRPVAASRWLARFVATEGMEQLRELPGLVRGSDLVVAATFVFGVRTAAELTGAAYRFVTFCPQFIPSACHPSLWLRRQRWPRFVNRLSWLALEKGGNLAIGRALDRERARLGLGPAGDIWKHVLGERPLVASDPELGSLPEDVAARCVQTGYLPLEEAGGLPPDVEAFLAEGEPPVYVGFGSMKSDDPAAAARIVLDAARSIGRRALVSRGWGGLGRVAGAKDFLRVGSVSHPGLFPRVAAVVHHGGAGTTATATRAGAAQVLCPHMCDQFWWAEQLERRGLAPPPVWRGKLSARALADALERALGDAAMAARRRALADALAGRDTIALTVDELLTTRGAGRSLPLPAVEGVR